MKKDLKDEEDCQVSAGSCGCVPCGCCFIVNKQEDLSVLTPQDTVLCSREKLAPSICCVVLWIGDVRYSQVLQVWKIVKTPLLKARTFWVRC